MSSAILKAGRSAAHRLGVSLLWSSACVALLACSGNDGTSGNSTGGTGSGTGAQGGTGSPTGVGGTSPTGSGGSITGGTAGVGSGGTTTAGAGGTLTGTGGVGGSAGTGAGGSGGTSGPGGGGGLGGCGSNDPTPPETWQEHWFEHEQLLQRVYMDEHVAVYFDNDMDQEEASWLFQFVSDSWQYTKQTYGCMGSDILYAIFHQDKYGGGHPSYYYDSSHDNRNVVDQGGGNWSGGQFDVPSHEIAHVVESTARHQSSPAFGLWMDSKWAEFYQYDLYVALGMTSDAERVFNSWSSKAESFPAPNTYWFRDWFYPLWESYGASVMVNFFGLIGEHWGGGGMNWGEYIHFTSGGAGENLKPLATEAFGWPGDWETQFNQARTDYPDVTALYTYP